MNPVGRPSPTADPATQRIHREQVRLLYAQAPLGAVASLIVAPLLALVAWEVLPHPVLVTWLALLETTILIRLALTFAFQRRSQPDADMERWAARYTWACTASGICWGGCALLLVLSPSLVYDTFIALILGGVMMGGVFTLAPVLMTYVAYALPLALPPLLWLLLHGDPLRAIMGTTGVLYLLLALGTAYRYHHALTQSLRLAQEKSELACSYAAAKQQAEDSNQQLAEQQAALIDSVAAMRTLYAAISIPRRHPGEQIQALLAMGCQRFGLNIGILSHVEGERYEVMQALAPGGEITQGDVFTLGDTYCRETLRAQQPLGFEQASASHQRQHPCYRKFKLEAYLGAPVRVGSQIYGTLNFSSAQPRPIPFTPVDRELIQLMAQWVGGTLEQEQMAATAQRQQALLAHTSRLNTLGEMASSLVHEINQPITAISLYAEAGLTQLQTGGFEPTDLQQALEKIAAQSIRVQTIIQHIRHFARQSKPQYSAVGADGLISDIADFLKLEARRHQVRIRHKIAPHLPWVLADALQIQQVILNLVRNAVDAIGDSEGMRTITVSAQPAQDAVEITVQDTGPGLAPDMLGQLLHPFFTTKPDGLGLGLSISQSIIEAHGGRLWATANPGPGVTFHFTLPVAHRVSPPERAPAEIRVSQTAAG
ncbi:MAG: GAF domain-containing protein [Candidatus Competibacteraceae bacterium]|nr:GAF domain-containing protein [Candidatus Competibacteraceae bacterium]